MQPEMSQNVQQYSKSVYLRASEAQQCKVQSTLVVPLFDGDDRHQPCGVLEVVQAVQDMRFDNVMQTLASVLQVRLNSYASLCMRSITKWNRSGHPAGADVLGFVVAWPDQACIATLQAWLC